MNGDFEIGCPNNNAYFYKVVHWCFFDPEFSYWSKGC